MPITRVFPGITEAEESAWQERVVRHLGLGEWHRVVLHDEVDAIGPLARTRLVEHGVLWPPNLAGDVPLIEAVPGGSVIDGEGGDEVLGDESHRVAEVQQLVREPWPLRKRRLRAALEAAAPARVRTSRARRHWASQLTWLTPAGRELWLDTLAREEGQRPLSYAASLLMVPRKRKQVLAARNRRLLAARSDVEITSPLLHQDFIRALARRGGALGPGDRTAVLRGLVPDLLPDDVLARTSKGEYTRCYMGRPTREFAARLVRGGRRSRSWSSPTTCGGCGRRRTPAAPTAALLQAAWLAGKGRTGTSAAN